MKRKILFIIDGCDPVLYRTNIGWILEVIDQNKFSFQVIDLFANPELVELIPNFDIILYYRVIRAENTGLYLAKELNKTIGYIMDDYLLEEAYGHVIREFMQNVNFVSVTTPILQEIYQNAGIHTPFFIKRTALPVARLLQYKQPGTSHEGEFRIGWLGGYTHRNPEYTALVEEVLRELSARQVNVNFICFGKPAEFIQRIEILPYIQIENLPFVPFEDEEKYYSSIANLGFDVVICPVANSKLNMGKSELKVWETGIYKIPIICSRIAMYPRVIEEGVNGMLADSSIEFVEKLIQLKNNPELRIQIGENSYQNLLAKGDVQKRVHELETFLLDISSSETERSE